MRRRIKCRGTSSRAASTSSSTSLCRTRPLQCTPSPFPFTHTHTQKLQRVPDGVPDSYSNAPLPLNPTEEQLRRASPQQLEQWNLTSPTAFWRVYAEFKRRDDAGSLRALKLVLLGTDVTHVAGGEARVTCVLGQRSCVSIESFAKVTTIFGPISEPTSFFHKVTASSFPSLFPRLRLRVVTDRADQVAADEGVVLQ